MGETILTKTASTGQQIEVRLGELNGTWAPAELWMDGVRIRGASRPIPLKTPKGGVTHYMGEKPAVGFTAAEAEQILAALEAAERPAKAALAAERKAFLEALPEPLKGCLKRYGTSERAWDAENEHAWAVLKEAGY